MVEANISKDSQLYINHNCRQIIYSETNRCKSLSPQELLLGPLRRTAHRVWSLRGKVPLRAISKVHNNSAYSYAVFVCEFTLRVLSLRRTEHDVRLCPEGTRLHPANGTGKVPVPDMHQP